tara:strand:+ start:548 stop:1324 length:777 start_codon:yes stop_codon:yes gene_type:complete
MLENVTQFYLNNKPWPIKIMLLLGDQYNYWTVLGDAVKTSVADGQRRQYVYCKCVCTRRQYVRKDDLLSGKSKSCGCSKSLEISKIEGEKFNSWTILEVKDIRGGHRYATCQCDCGHIRDVRLWAVKSGQSKACGCTRKGGRTILTDIIGEEFGHLVALEVDHTHEKYGAFWKCLCKICGNETVVQRSNLINGTVSSCGCRRGKNRKIARLLGYNEGIVSLVLRNKHRDKSHIKPEMVTKIKNLAKELNYKPGYNLHT